MKTTKRALFSSVMALILCFSMLVGTTFAWFTDEVKSDVNKIVAGNLDVNLYHSDNKVTDEPVTVATKLFDDVNPNLWEPGALAYEILTVANEGTLALKYQLAINFENATTVNGHSLVEALKVAVVDENLLTSREAAIAAAAGNWQKLESFILPGELAAEESETYGIVIYWEPTENDNWFNLNKGETEVLSIDLGVHLFATQLQAEIDSFGKDYDNGAFIPVAPEALPENGDDLVLNGSAESKTTVTVPAAVAEALKETGVTSLSVEVSAPVVDTNTNTVTYTTVELVDQNGNEVDLSNSTAKLTVKLYVGDLFAQDEQVEVYHDGAFVTYATVDANGYISYEVSHFCEVSVKVAEEVVLDNTIDSVKEFMAFAAAVNAGNTYAGKTVVLGADLDLAGVTWTPIGTSSNPFKGTFDGNGKVIKNLSVLMAGKSNVGLFGFTTDGEIKNVTVENAKVAGRLNVGVVAGTPYTSKYTNITVQGHVEVDGMAYVGGVGGKNAYANWNNVTVNVDATSYVNANSVENGTAYRTYVGGVVGFNGEGGHSFTNITSNINVIGSTCDIGGAFGIAHYGNKFENVTVTGTVTGAEGAYEVGGIAGVWNNTNGYTVTFTNCTYAGELSIVGSAYNTTGTGILIIDGVEYVGSVGALKAQLNAGKTSINFAGDINGDVTVTQAPDVKITIDGNGYKFNGVITVDGKSARYEGAALTIQNVNFEAETLSADAFIRLGHVDAARYTNNVTVKDCTFSGKGFVAVKSYTGGDWNVTLENLTVNAGMHSLAQLKNVEKNLIVTGCKVYSKNGLNVNNGTNLTMSGCTFEVQGYAVRFGESDNTTNETFAISNSTLKSACAEAGDAVIEFRKGAVNATLTLTNTTLEGTTTFKGHTDATTITVDGKACVATAAQLADVVASGVTDIYLLPGEYNVANCGGKTLTISGSKDAVLKLYNEGEDGVDYGFDSSTVTFNGVTIDTTANTGNYKGYGRMTATFNDCNFFGAYASFQNNTFNNCTFNFNNGYFWTWGAEALTFNGCTFNGNSKAILAHGRASTVININNCNFAATEKGYTGAGDNTAVVEMDPIGSNTYTINFTGENTITDSYAGWTRVKDGSTGHIITGLN